MLMSEYQYYEFQAIDRDLTDKEMSELRAFSTKVSSTGYSDQEETSRQSSASCVGIKLGLIPIDVIDFLYTPAHSHTSPNIA